MLDYLREALDLFKRFVESHEEQTRAFKSIAQAKKEEVRKMK